MMNPRRELAEAIFSNAVRDLIKSDGEWHPATQWCGLKDRAVTPHEVLQAIAMKSSIAADVFAQVWSGLARGNPDE